MEIIAQTPRRLELGYRDTKSGWGSKVGATLFGLAFCGFGIWGMFAGRQKILKCIRLDPVQIECQLTTSGLIGSETITLANVQQAQLIKRRGASRPNRSTRKDVYGVVLITDDQKTAISAVSTSNYPTKQAEVRRINSFINNPQQFALNLRSDGRGLGLIVGGILATIGCGVIYALWQVKMVSKAVFNRDLARVKIHKTSVYGQLEQLSWYLREIEQSFIEESRGKNDTYYSLNLKFSDRQRQRVTLLRTTDRLKAETLLSTIRQFLDEI
ncbi:MAG: hypothetical protein AAFQ41_07080 [Cyanobacteria bacterium J06623_7]